jgi:hypothetical protein
MQIDFTEMHENAETLPGSYHRINQVKIVVGELHYLQTGYSTKLLIVSLGLNRLLWAA